MTDPAEVPPWTPELLRALAKLRDDLTRSPALQLSAQFSPVTIPSIGWAGELQKATQAWLDQAAKQFARAARMSDAIQQIWLDSVPDNWVGISSDGDAINLVATSGIAIVWAPRLEIIEALIVSGDRPATLTQFSDEILDDLQAVLLEARGAEVPGHQDACDFADEAISAAMDGHWSAAQALAASGLGQVIHVLLGYPLKRGLGAAYREFSQRDIDETLLSVFKVALLEVCTVKALTDIENAPVHRFDRHATQHGDRRFFSQANALSGLLLLVGWIREFTWIAENRPEFLSDGEES